MLQPVCTFNDLLPLCASGATCQPSKATFCLPESFAVLLLLQLLR